MMRNWMNGISVLFAAAMLAADKGGGGTATVDIEAELSKATKVKQKDGEKRQKYLGRLATEVNELADEDFDALSKDAQDWTNSALAKMNKKKDVEDFPGAEAEEEATDEEEAKPAKKAAKADDEEDEAPAKPTRVRATAKADDEEDEAPAKPAKKKAEKKGPGATSQLREYILKNPKATREQCMEFLKEAELTIGDTTRNIVYYDTHTTLKMLKRLGKLTDAYSTKVAGDE